MSELVDQYGRPIERRALATEQASPIGGVRDVWYDSQATGLTPSKLATILKGLREGEIADFITLADEMEEREPHYASVLGTRKNALAGIEPVVEAASDAARDIELADAVRELVRRPAFEGLVDDLLDALSKGFSAVEIVWDTAGKQWLPESFRWIDQRWFLFDQQTRELRLRDREDPKGQRLAPWKWIVHYPRLKPGFAVSGGLARIAAVAFMCKNYTLKDWMRFVEMYGMPLRVGRYGASASPADKAILKRAVLNIGADAAAILPESMQIEFQQAGNQAGGIQLYRGTAEWLDKQMSKAVLGQTASTEGTPGSLGGQDEQADVRRDILRKDARKLAATLNAELVRPFIDLNFGRQANYPAIGWVIKDPEDLKTMGDFLAQTVPLGLRVQASEVRDKAGLADPDEGAEVLALAAAPLAPAMNHRQPRPALNARKSDDVVDELAEIALEGWKPVMLPALNSLEALADDCSDLEEFRGRLAEAVNTMELAELTESLATALFASRVAGQNNA